MKKEFIILIAIIAIAIVVIVATRKPKFTDLRITGATSAQRRNNVGNLRPSAIPYTGTVGVNNNFAIFESVEHGARAMRLLLNSYINKGYDTITKIINRYAPSSDNNVQAYINSVVTATAYDANSVLTSAHIESLMFAMHTHEVGTKNTFLTKSIIKNSFKIDGK